MKKILRLLKDNDIQMTVYKSDDALRIKFTNDEVYSKSYEIPPAMLNDSHASIKKWIMKQFKHFIDWTNNMQEVRNEEK